MEELDLILEELSYNNEDDDIELCMEDCARLNVVLEALSEDEINSLIGQSKALYKKYNFDPNAKLSESSKNDPKISKILKKLRKQSLEKLKKNRLKSIKLITKAMQTYDRNKDENVIITVIKVLASIWGLGLLPYYLLGKKTSLINEVVPASMLQSKFNSAITLVKAVNTVIAEKEKKLKGTKESWSDNYTGYTSVFDRIYNL